MPKLATLGDPDHCRWPCPTWRSPHCPSIRKVEDTTATPQVPSRNHQIPVVCMWMCLLAGHKQSHRRSSLAVWDLHLVPGPKCCSTPHSTANSVLPMADVCHRHLYLRRNWLPDLWQLLFKDDPHLTSSIWPEQCCQSCLAAQRDVVRAWNSQSTLLWQWPSVCECIIHWVLHFLGITHETSSPHYLQSNGFAEACVKSMKHALQCAKYSGADSQLTLLALWATPIDAKLLSPAELLYQCQIRTTIPARICNTNLAALQIHEQIEAHSDASKWQPHKQCKSLAPLYAGQAIAMYNTLHKIWIPATVVCVLPKNSYQ